MRILFSPVGTADPMTQLGDGPMLHIARHWHPDIAVLFMSPALAEYERRDHRYSRALKLLPQPPEDISPVISEEREVYRFDRYISAFEACLERIAEEHPEAEILVNVSSGTPGMLEALVALGSFGRTPMKMLQVTTPAKGINRKQDRENPDDYDLETLWEINPDNEQDAPCRIIEVDAPNFTARVKRENIAALVESYDYAAALLIAKTSPCVKPAALELLGAAADRINLSLQVPAKVFGGTALKCQRQDPLAEYLAVMEVKLKQDDGKGFLLSLSPALSTIMDELLNSSGCPPFKDRYGKFDLGAINADQELAGVLSRYTSSNSSRFISNAAYFALVKKYCAQHPSFPTIKRLREIEEDSRNTLAHEIVNTSRQSLERAAGVKLPAIMAMLAGLCPRFVPGLYDQINVAILEAL